MVISCPLCGRSGTLPKQFNEGVHAVRCRRCKSRFWTSSDRAEWDIEEVARETLDLPKGPNDSRLGEWSELADDDSVEFELGSGDSHYELPVMRSTGNGVNDDWEDQVESSVPRGNRGSPLGGHLAWLSRFPAIWDRIQLQAAVVFGVGSALLIGVLLSRAIWGRGDVSASTSLLVVGFLGAIGFVWLSVSMTRLFLLLEDLSRTLERLKPGDTSEGDHDGFQTEEKVSFSTSQSRKA